VQEIMRGEKCGKLAVVLARRIDRRDSALVDEMEKYLNNYSRSRIDRLYQKLVVDRGR